MTHIWVDKLTITGSDNGLSPGRRQAIIWTNAGILLIWHSGTNFSEIWIEMYTFIFQKMYFKMSSGKWGPFCFDLNVLSSEEDHWTGWSDQQLVYANNKRNTKAPHFCPFARGIHRQSVDSLHKGPAMRKNFSYHLLRLHSNVRSSMFKKWCILMVTTQEITILDPYI